MDKPIFPEISQYERLNSDFFKEFKGLSLENEFLLFWKKWSYLHSKLIINMRIGFGHSIFNENELNLISKNFLNKRKAMISAFIQGIKKHPEFNNELKTLRIVIFKHDALFMSILKESLSKLLNELNRLQNIRKVTSAYMNTQYSMGG